MPQRGFGYSGERSAYTELFVPFPELERAKELERALLTSEPSFPEDEEEYASEAPEK